MRLAGRGSLNSSDFAQFSAIVFGEGDHPTPTENRPAPPALVAGDRLALGPLTATVEEILGRPRLFSLRFDGPPDAVWAGPARHGRPIQYSHIEAPLTLWEVHIEALRMTGRSIPTGVLPRGASECKAKGLPARRGTPI